MFSPQAFKSLLQPDQEMVQPFASLAQLSERELDPLEENRKQGICQIKSRLLRIIRIKEPKPCHLRVSASTTYTQFGASTLSLI